MRSIFMQWAHNSNTPGKGRQTVILDVVFTFAEYEKLRTLNAHNCSVGTS